MYCSSCGASGQAGSHFCERCGADLDSQGATQSALLSQVSAPSYAFDRGQVPSVAAQGTIPSRARRRLAVLIGAIGWVFTGTTYFLNVVTLNSSAENYFSQNSVLYFRLESVLSSIGYLMIAIAVTMLWKVLKRHVPAMSLVLIVLGLYVLAILQGFQDFVAVFFVVTVLESKLYVVAEAVSYIIPGVGAVIGALGLKRTAVPD